MKKILSMLLLFGTLLIFVSCDEREQGKPFDMTLYNEFEIAEGEIYKGVFGTKETTVKLANGMGEVELRTSIEVSTEVSCIIVERVVFASAVIEGDILTLNGRRYVVYQRQEYIGAGAEKYKSECRTSYEEQFASKKIDKNSYERLIALLNGEERLVVCADGSESDNYCEIKVQLGEEKSCRVLKCSSDEPLESTDNSVIQKMDQEYEYTSDGKLVKSVIYGKNEFIINADENDLTIVTYHADGKTVKIAERFGPNSDDNMGYDTTDPMERHEYREDGTKERTIVVRHSYTGSDSAIHIEDPFVDGDPMTVVYYKRIFKYDEKENLITAKGYDKQEKLQCVYNMEYDGNGNRISQDEYDGQGNITGQITKQYDENRICICENEYDGNGIIVRSVETDPDKCSNVIKFFSDGNLTLRIEMLFYEEAEKGGTELVEFGSANGYYMVGVKSRIDYDADGNITYSVEYDKDGNKINE
ncbi:MAG: hypothetical protein E7648_08060 [Ruminococcaceae bacterium]|nr:hypothetical protein [Oscillospiraceae bacterium]